MVVLNAWTIIEILQHICVEHYWGSCFTEWIQMKAFAMHRGVLILLHVMETRRRDLSSFWCYWCRLWSYMWEGTQLPKKKQDTLEVISASRDIGQADFYVKIQDLNAEEPMDDEICTKVQKTILWKEQYRETSNQSNARFVFQGSVKGMTTAAQPELCTPGFEARHLINYTKDLNS